MASLVQGTAQAYCVSDHSEPITVQLPLKPQPKFSITSTISRGSVPYQFNTYTHHRLHPTTDPFPAQTSIPPGHKRPLGVAHFLSPASHAFWGPENMTAIKVLAGRTNRREEPGNPDNAFEPSHLNT